MELVIRVLVEPEFDDLPLPSEDAVYAEISRRIAQGEYETDGLTFYVDTVTMDQA